ncbi:armadillo repeat-containing protein 2 [Rhinatrema bivittatum]|uniref:armadillo repeat-containing protein 2 n=1 Tax=Rhinatrema bivittatum TaxID=194408 RepID=UPI001128A1DB|nr:armadillo repeat-containing protein 2 [Rhinatrema bivittatum]
MDKKSEQSDLFYKPPASLHKTSAEIINEARNALRSLKTQRPFTPREEQRKLFGGVCSRTLERRPPSSFSLHGCSFELPDSRPVSGARLSPLYHIPKLPAPPTNEEGSALSLPKPPLDPVEMRRISSSHARLFKTAAKGNFLPDKLTQADAVKKRLCLEGPLLKTDLSGGDVGRLADLNVHNHCKDGSQLTEHAEPKREKQIIGKGIARSAPPQHMSTGDLVGRHGRPSSCPSNPDCSKVSSKTGSDAGPSSESETKEEAGFWNEKIAPVLHELEPAHIEGNVESLCHACTRLHQALEEGNMLGRRCKRRALVLKTLYKLVDIGSDQLGLKLAKVILALKVSGKNLLNVCKLVFKISRSENNDLLFQKDSLFDSLLEVLKSEELIANREAFLYCLGTIKFLSGNAELLKDILAKGAVETLVHLMKQINNAFKESPADSSSLGHLSVQLTATLRNLADLPHSRPKFLHTSALSELCVALEQQMDDKDVCTNIARIFSKLSSYNACCVALADCSRCYASFLAALSIHQKKQDLVVRVLFTLGNLTAKNSQAREQLFGAEGSIDSLLSLFHTYYELDMHEKQVKGDGRTKNENEKLPSAVEDILIKLIRVLANISIHPSIGAELAASEKCVALLIKVLNYKSVDECEELVINTTATINNLSYYQGQNSIIKARKLSIADLLLKLLMSNSMDGILEAARVFGNLSRYQEVRDFIVQKNVYKFMIALLDAKHQDVCFSACGVLINLTADSNKRAILKEEGGIKKLMDCLRDFGPSDWQLAGLVCKTFWNYSENITNAALCFGVEETNTLLELLSSYLDEELALDYSSEGDLREYHRACWESEFRPVALQLLGRIQSHHTYLEPLPMASC